MTTNAILNKSSNKAELILALLALITNLPLVFPGGSIPINGVMTTIVQIVAILKAQLAAEQAAQAQKLLLHSLVVAADDGLPNVREMVRDIVSWSGPALGRSSNAFASLGFAPVKKAVTPVAVKAEAAVKAKATRAHDNKGTGGATAEPAEAPSSAKKPTGGNG